MCTERSSLECHLQDDRRQIGGHPSSYFEASVPSILAPTSASEGDVDGFVRTMAGAAEMLPGGIVGYLDRPASQQVFKHVEGVAIAATNVTSVVAPLG